MAFYEVVFITRQDLIADDVDNLSDKFSKIVTDNGGKVASKEYWGLRNLSYKIKKNNRGHYVLFNITSEYPAVAELKRVMGFNEDVIRSAVFKVEKHLDQSHLFISVNAKDKPAVKTKKDQERSDFVPELQFEF
jgi:small subunit ribosomal protein S6